MNESSTSAKGFIMRVVNRAGLSKVEASRRMGRQHTFLTTYTARGRIPSLQLAAEIAAVCGFEIHLIGHGEDILIEAE